MTVLYFAHARSAAGVSQERIAIEAPLTIEALWALLIDRHPALAPLRSTSRLARSDDFLPASAQIQPDDEIAIIPPVSGG